MAGFCKEHELKKAAEGDLKTLTDFDKRGLIIGSEETPETYVERLKIFQKNLTQLEADLKDKEEFVVEDIKFPSKEKIPSNIFTPAGKITSELYDFKIDWVPGFYITPEFGMLFGGCAYSFDPDFFSLFIIRNSFKKKDKWLIYSRDELMSHELCHVARFALKAHTYEEMFAYQTSTSGFRRKFGSMMRAAWETYVLMTILFTMLASQIYLISFKAEWMAEQTILTNPINWFYGVLFLFVSFLVMRQKTQNKNVSATLTRLKAITNKPRALAFRLSDNELDELLSLKVITKDSFLEVLKNNKCSDIRLKILSERFLNGK